MSIKITRNPSDQTLKELGVPNWEVRKHYRFG